MKIFAFRKIDLLLWDFFKQNTWFSSLPKKREREKQTVKICHRMSVNSVFPTFLPSPTLAQIQTYTKKQTKTKIHFRVNDVMVPRQYLSYIGITHKWSKIAGWQTPFILITALCFVKDVFLPFRKELTAIITIESVQKGLIYRPGRVNKFKKRRHYFTEIQRHYF